MEAHVARLTGLTVPESSDVCLELSDHGRGTERSIFRQYKKSRGHASKHEKLELFLENRFERPPTILGRQD
jgi:hypothetical protein